MQNNLAYVVKKVNDVTGHPPVKKTLQKLIYLLEQKGVDFNYDYILHFYGPYCSALDFDTFELSSEGVLEFEYTKYGHKIFVNDRYEIKPDFEDEQFKIIDGLIGKFKKASPSDLELLATTIYTYKHTGAETIEKIVENVKKIKGEKYCEDEIMKAINELSFFQIDIQR